MQLENLLSYKSRQSISFIITISIALVWFTNGLFCKVLNLVPRHQEIVERILGETYASPITKTIGVLEIGMSIWVLSGIRSRFSAIFQLVIIATMNSLEFALAPDLLLFGKMNIVYAFLFMIIIYLNEFHIKTKKLRL